MQCVVAVNVTRAIRISQVTDANVDFKTDSFAENVLFRDCTGFLEIGFFFFQATRQQVRPSFANSMRDLRTLLVSDQRTWYARQKHIVTEQRSAIVEFCGNATGSNCFSDRSFQKCVARARVDSAIKCRYRSVSRAAEARP